MRIKLRVFNPKNTKEVREAIYDFIEDEGYFADECTMENGENENEYWIYDEYNDRKWIISIEQKDIMHEILANK